MNYEELLESRNGAAMKKEQMPFGSFYKKMQDKKYTNVVDLRSELLNSLVFNEALVAESQAVAQLNNNHQIHFSVNADSAGIYGITLEPGNYHTYERLLDENPAIVAGKGFIDNTVTQLFEFTEYLHEHGIYHVCYAPNNLFARKGDNSMMMLFHGSAYDNIRDKKMLYLGVEQYVAPEVLDGSTADARSDVYSLGRFLEFLYRDSGLPFEQKSVLKKATEADPEKRYQTVTEMQSAMKQRSNTRKFIFTLIGALLATLIFVGMFFSLVPEQEDIEYVAPVEEKQTDDLLDDGFDPTTELGAVPDTTIKVDEKKMKEFEAKAEQIFRKQFAKEAERILSRVYNSDKMNGDENAFMALSSSANEELMRKQGEMAGQAGLSNTKGQRIASEIIDQVTNRLKAKVGSSSSKGIQREQTSDESQIKSMVDPINQE